MSDFKDVPTEQLLNFQEFTPVHEASFSNAQLTIENPQKQNDFISSYPQNANNDKDEAFTDPQNGKGKMN